MHYAVLLKYGNWITMIFINKTDFKVPLQFTLLIDISLLCSLYLWSLFTQKGTHWNLLLDRTTNLLKSFICSTALNSDQCFFVKNSTLISLRMQRICYVSSALNICTVHFLVHCWCMCYFLLIFCFFLEYVFLSPWKFLH